MIRALILAALIGFVARMGRTNGDGYVAWDPNPPCYLAEDSDRGPYVYCAFEWDAYRWVRGQVSAEDIAANRAYLRAMGCTYTG